LFFQAGNTLFFYFFTLIFHFFSFFFLLFPEVTVYFKRFLFF